MSRSVASFDLRLRGLDPVSVLERLLPDGERGFLLEKEEDGRRRAWVGAVPFESVRVLSGKAVLETSRGRRVLKGNPFDVLGARIAAHRARGGEPFDGGAVGLLGYEMVRHLERVPMRTETEEGFLSFYREVLVIQGGRASLRALVAGAADRRKAARRARELSVLLYGAGPAPVPRTPPLRLEPRRGRAAYLRAVRRLKERIFAGDIFQAVVSESFSAPLPLSPFDAYRAVRAANVVPYGFLLVDGKTARLGASPERLVRVVGGRARNCPIAGTRPRGATPAADRALERGLRADEKEKAEHLMLVDLARNDLGRVCAPGSVAVERFMFTKRFSNVMHLVSEVEGRLDAGKTAWDVLAASFPAGTVSGAPKVRAMELIAAEERRPRGFYAGAVVQADGAGNLDSCLAIRSLELSRGRARLQAGAGIVADSRPEKEWDEVNHKLAGLRRALGGKK